ncbi:hypothetical protein F5B22DRAFT_656120 [Xylaria bambusicola]|uniref:uncharacterized protein n=1 Tax=Xylaria bambusicola TaxID=326684 RepID=UPI002007E8B6|nr:uncharacterized protein F5B22DRAFT_656120 [Xylaria bambusicola]KAI0515448.1 hypothetical protein F5B22DRAFT_656120 [Xylaria bambusicola]
MPALLPSVIHSAAASHNRTLVGWVSSSIDRGTIDILWSCSITILLCCWVATHPNAAAPTDKWYHRFIDKFNLAMIGLLGPDFLFGIALGQFSSARRCVRLFKRDAHLLNGNQLTYRYAFFLNMGGLHLTSPDFPSGFPITGHQLHYLVKHDHVDFPNLKAMAIDERNTTDTLSRLVTVWQVLWFSVAEIQRVRDGLPTTTLELTALSFVVVMIATSVCWFRKPSITIPQTIPTKGGKLVYNIRANAKEQTHPDLKLEIWYRTPLDFIRDDRWGIDTHWSYYTRISHIIHVRMVSRPVKTRPWNRLPSDQWLPPDQVLIPFGSLILLLFSSSFLIAWNFYFPTKTEQWLWRGFAIYHSVFVVYGGVYYLIEAIRWNKRKPKDSAEGTSGVSTIPHGDTAQDLIRPSTSERNVSPAQQQPTCNQTNPIAGSHWQRWYWITQQRIVSLRNISADKDPDMVMPLRVIVPVTVTCVLYIIARGFLYIEDFISLRLQPANTYESVNKFLPFIGDG